MATLGPFQDYREFIRRGAIGNGDVSTSIAMPKLVPYSSAQLQRRSLPLKNLMSALCALAILTGSGAAMAANTIGTIKYIDTKERTFTFNSGTTYKAEKTVDLENLQVGERVMVTWEMKNGFNQASHVKAQ